MFYKLSHAGYEYVKNRIAKLNRIATKLEQPTITFELIKKEAETDPKTLISQTMYYIYCIGDAPKLKDWKFMATLDFTPKGNLFNTTYDYNKEGAVKIPDRFKSTPFTLCEDCHVQRYRTWVFVLHNEKNDKWMQVGSTCLGTFLGVKESEVHELAEFATTLASMPNAMKKWTDKYAKSKKNNDYTGYKKVDLLASMFSYVRRVWEKIPHDSWRIRSSARNSLYYGVLNFVAYSKELKATDRNMTDKMLKFFETWKPAYPHITYDNMLTVLKNEVIARRHYKFLSRAFDIYMSAESRNLFPAPIVKPVYTPVPQTQAVTQVRVAPISKTPTVPSNYLGNEGQNIILNLETTVVYSGGRFKGHTPLTLTDARGNQLYWWCPYFYRVNDKIRINTASVKHREHKGIKQTEISYVTFTKLKGN